MIEFKIINIERVDSRSRVKINAIWNGKKKYWSVPKGVYEVLLEFSKLPTPSQEREK